MSIPASSCSFTASSVASRLASSSSAPVCFQAGQSLLVSASQAGLGRLPAIVVSSIGVSLIWPPFGRTFWPPFWAGTGLPRSADAAGNRDRTGQSRAMMWQDAPVQAIHHFESPGFTIRNHCLTVFAITPAGVGPHIVDRRPRTHHARKSLASDGKRRHCPRRAADRKREGDGLNGVQYHRWLPGGRFGLH